MKKTFRFAWVLTGIALTGCGGDSDELGFSIYGTPQRLHVPSDAHFELTRDDGMGVETCRGEWDFGDGVTLAGEYEATHRYREPGTYRVEVDLTCSGRRGHSAMEIEAYDSVDLAVTSLEARPLNISSNGALDVSFQVANLAQESLKAATYLDVYLTPGSGHDGYLSSGAMRIYRQTLSSMEGNGHTETHSVSIPMDASVRTGAYYVAVVADPEGGLGEVSRENNVAVSTQTVTVRNQATDGADFSAVRLDVLPARTSMLSAATAQFSVVNLGATTDETFGYALWLGARGNATDMTGAVKIHESTIPGGMSGVEQTFNNIMVSVAPAVTAEGLYYFWLVLDPEDRLVERDETNNIVRSSAPVQVSNEVLLDADIMVQTLTFSPGTSSRGGTFTAQLDVVNQGAQPTGSFVCTLFLSEDMSLDIDRDTVVGSVNIDDLPASSTRHVTTIAEVGTGLSAGEYWVYVFCDSSGVVAEANEENNIQRGETPLVLTDSSQIDMLFGQVSLPSGENVADGGALSVSAVLCNKGTTAAGPSYLSVVLMGLCSDRELEVSRELVDGLEAGECRTLALAPRVSCDFWCPYYGVTLRADATQIVVETNESNNEVTLNQNVTIEGEDCVCVGDSEEPNDVWSQATLTSTMDRELTLCKGDVDFYRLDMGEGDNVEVRLNHDSARSPLKLRMYRGTEVVKEYTGGDDLYFSSMHTEDVEEKNVLIEVLGAESDSANRYHLSVDIYKDGTGVDLAASDLQNEKMLSASEETPVSVSIDNLGSEASPQVWIGFYLSPDGNLGDDAIRLTRVSQNAMAPGATVRRQVMLRLPADLPGGKYHLVARVDDDNTSGDSRISNNIARTSVFHFDRSCYDSLDPNDTFESARVLSLQNGRYTHSSLTVCQGNPDYYAFDVSHGQSLDISVANAGTGDFDIVLMDAVGNEIASSRTGAATETIHRDVIVGDQRLYLYIYQVENTYNSNESEYTLTIETSPASEWNRCEPEFEPNNFKTSAYDLMEVVRSGMTAQLCPTTDEDYYKIDMTTGDRLQLGFHTDSTILRAGLYAGDRLVSILTNLRSQSFDYTAVEEATHYVRIYTNASTFSVPSYQLRWLGEEGVDIAVSSLVASPAVAGLPVTVEFDVSNKGTQSSQVAISIVLGPHSLSLSAALDAGETRHVAQKIVLSEKLLGAQTLAVIAEAPDDVVLDNNRAQLVLDVAPACQNDAFEPNDTPLAASPVATTASGIICPGDEDWFALPDGAARARLDFSHAEGDLRLETFSADGLALALSDSASDSEELPANGAAFVRITGANSSISATYTLTIE